MGLGKAFIRSKTEEHTRNIGLGSFGIDGRNELFGFGQIQLYRGALSIPGVARSAQLIADTIASLPWELYRDRAGNPVEKLPKPVLLDQPSPPDTRVDTFSGWAYDYLFHGNAVGIISSRDSNGAVTSVYPVPVEMVGIRRILRADDSWLPIGAIEYRIGDQLYGPSEVIHIKGPCRPGDVRGYGVLEKHQASLELSHEQLRQAYQLGDSGIPTGVLTNENPDLTPEQALALKTAWLASQRDRTIAVLNGQTTFTPLAWNPTEMQMLEARQFQLHEIALMFGLPLSFLGAETTNTHTYTNIEGESLQLLKFTLLGIITRFEQALSQCFPRGTYVKADVDYLLRADTFSRYQSHAIGIASGFLKVNEARDIEDLPPLSVAELKELQDASKPPPPVVKPPGQDPNANPGNPIGGADQ